MSTRLRWAVLAVASSMSPVAVADEAPAPGIGGPFAPRGVAPTTQPRALPATVRLAWTDPGGAAVGLEFLARAEADLLLRKMGLTVSWRRGEAGELARAGEVRVTFLDRRAPQDSGVPVLGATPSTLAVAPLVWVHLPSVASAIGVVSGRPARLDPPEARALGVAVGRVIAHEVVHALAPSVPHGVGLMSASLTRRHLTAASIPVDPEVALALQSALRGEVLLPRPDTGVLAAATEAEETER